MQDYVEILISVGYGCGWSTWRHGGTKEETIFMLTYRPFIDAIHDNDGGFPKEEEEIVALKAQFVHDWEACFGVDSRVPYMGGVEDLTVFLACDSFRVKEYDGSESVDYQGDADWFSLSDLV